MQEQKIVIRENATGALSDNVVQNNSTRLYQTEKGIYFVEQRNQILSEMTIKLQKVDKTTTSKNRKHTANQQTKSPKTETVMRRETPLS